MRLIALCTFSRASKAERRKQPSLLGLTPLFGVSVS
jgi:hypothetical protein